MGFPVKISAHGELVPIRQHAVEIWVFDNCVVAAHHIFMDVEKSKPEVEQTIEMTKLLATQLGASFGVTRINEDCPLELDPEFRAELDGNVN